MAKCQPQITQTEFINMSFLRSMYFLSFSEFLIKRFIQRPEFHEILKCLVL